MGCIFDHGAAFDPRRRGQFSVSDKTFASPFFHYFMETNFGKPCRFEKECA